MSVLMEKVNTISEVELEALTNFFVRESFEIISEEIEYYVSIKEKMADIFIEGINFYKINESLLQQGIEKIVYCEKDLKNLYSRVGRRIDRELTRTQFNKRLEFGWDEIDAMKRNDSILFLKENIKTFILSNIICKGIDGIWKKTSSQFLPKELTKFSSKISMGRYFLSSLGVNPEEISNGMKKKIAIVMKGIIKQHGLELANMLKQEILIKLEVCEASQLNEINNNLKQQKIMTA
ncbi:MAG: hypothetical protein ACOYVD_17655 [Bacillota bacterium]